MMRLRLHNLFRPLAILIAIVAALWYFSLSPFVKEVRPIELPACGFADGIPVGQPQVYRSMPEFLRTEPEGDVRSLSEIDFGKSDLVQIVWLAPGYVVEGVDGTRGPVQFGQLSHSTRMGCSTIVFHVGDSAGTDFWQRKATLHQVFEQQLNESWFVVPKGAKVQFSNSTANIAPLDLAFILLFVLLGLFAVSEFRRTSNAKRTVRADNVRPDPQAIAVN